MLETVTRCPMCGSDSRHRRFDAMPDFVFHATDEHWSIDQCDRCDSLFLAQRPDVETIGRYYERYYTHDDQSDAPAISGISVRSGFAKKLANSWRNHEYGSHRPSLGGIGVAMALFFPPLRRWIDAECRHLPTRKGAPSPLSILDVGHGDGRFLKFAQEIGHKAAGVEIDPKAVARARGEQLDVHPGDIDAAALIWGDESFDYITMSHVIEHVHDPRHVIGMAARLLRHGGRLWIECPNAKAPGLRHYGKRWRDLDPPRHLCIPSLTALCAVAAEHGLVLDRLHDRPFVAVEVYPFSAVASGRSARSGYAKAAWASLMSLVARNRREWLTVTFIKPPENDPAGRR